MRRPMLANPPIHGVACADLHQGQAMSPDSYIRALPWKQRAGERRRLAKLIGCSESMMKMCTSSPRSGEAAGVPYRRPGDWDDCVKLAAATNGLVQPHEWNPQLAKVRERLLRDRG